MKVAYSNMPVAELEVWNDGDLLIRANKGEAALVVSHHDGGSASTKMYRVLFFGTYTGNLTPSHSGAALFEAGYRKAPVGYQLTLTQE